MCALIASGYLDIHVIKGPLYYDKVGFFSDDEHNVVVYCSETNSSRCIRQQKFRTLCCKLERTYFLSGLWKIWHSDLIQAIDKGVYFDSKVYRFDELSDYFLDKHNINKEIDETKFQDSIKLNYFDYDLLSPAGPQDHQITAFYGWKKTNNVLCWNMLQGLTKLQPLLCRLFFENQNTVVISTPLKMVSEKLGKTHS